MEYDVIDKLDPDEETLLQRLLTRAPKRHSVIPAETVVDPPRERDGDLNGRLEESEPAE